ERGDESFSDHCKRDAEESLFLCIGFNFSLDAALRIQEQRNDAFFGLQILDVICENRVQVAYAVLPGERKIRPVVLIEQGDRLARKTILSLPVAKNRRQSTAEPFANVCTRGAMHLEQWRL